MVLNELNDHGMIFFVSNFSRKDFTQWEEHPTFIQLIQTPPCQDFPWVFPLWNRVSRKPRYPGQFHLNLVQSYFVGQSLSHSILWQKQVLGNEFSGGIFQSSSNGNFLLTGLERARWEWQSWVRYPGFPAAGTFSPSWDLPLPTNSGETTGGEDSISSGETSQSNRWSPSKKINAWFEHWYVNV